MLRIELHPSIVLYISHNQFCFVIRTLMKLIHKIHLGEQPDDLFTMGKTQIQFFRLSALGFPIEFKRITALNYHQSGWPNDWWSGLVTPWQVSKHKFESPTSLSHCYLNGTRISYDSKLSCRIVCLLGRPFMTHFPAGKRLPWQHLRRRITPRSSLTYPFLFIKIKK